MLHFLLLFTPFIKGIKASSTICFQIYKGIIKFCHKFIFLG